MPSRRVLALVAFLGHYPAVYLLTRRSLGAPVLRANLWAGGLTLAAMLAAYVKFGAPGALVAWLVGHFAWSAALAAILLRAPSREGLQ